MARWLIIFTIVLPTLWAQAQMDENANHTPLAAVQIKARWGYIDTTGALKQPPWFLQATDFAEGIAAVQFSTGGWGYIDKRGMVVLPDQYQQAKPFEHGKAWVMQGDNWLRINTWGEPDSTSAEEPPASTQNRTIDSADSWIYKTIHPSVRKVRKSQNKKKLNSHPHHLNCIIGQNYCFSLSDTLLLIWDSDKQKVACQFAHTKPISYISQYSWLILQKADKQDDTVSLILKLPLQEPVRISPQILTLHTDALAYLYNRTPVRVAESPHTDTEQTEGILGLGDWGYMDNHLDMAIPPVFQMARPFR